MKILDLIKETFITINSYLMLEWIFSTKEKESLISKIKYFNLLNLLSKPILNEIYIEKIENNKIFFFLNTIINLIIINYYSLITIKFANQIGIKYLEKFFNNNLENSEKYLYEEINNLNNDNKNIFEIFWQFIKKNKKKIKWILIIFTSVINLFTLTMINNSYFILKNIDSNNKNYKITKIKINQFAEKDRILSYILPFILILGVDNKFKNNNKLEIINIIYYFFASEKDNFFANIILTINIIIKIIIQKIIKTKEKLNFWTRWIELTEF